MFSLIYELIVIFGFLLFLPKAIIQGIRFKKYRTSMPARLGIGFPQIVRKGHGPIIWVHAVSVGEAWAVSAIVKRLSTELHEPTICISSVTETGHAEAKRVMPFADHHVYLPFDFFFSVRKVLSRCTPDIVILCEGDFWYRFLKEAKKKGAVTIAINGKMSLQSEKRYATFSFFARKLFSLVDYFCVQSELYKKRFIQVGVPASKIRITGNSKCDLLPLPLDKEKLGELKQKLCIKPNDLVLVIGSTHDPEEDELFKEIAPLIEQFTHLKIIIAPRHPERFSEVAAIIEKHHLSYSRWTKPSQATNPKVFLIDAMGILRHCYQLADVAIVAGSFTQKVGGHNILEAQAFGVPVITGPYMHSQPQLLESSLSYNAILQVEIHEIQATLASLLDCSKKRSELKNNSLTMISALQGATDKSIDAVRSLAPQFF